MAIRPPLNHKPSPPPQPVGAHPNGPEPKGIDPRGGDPKGPDLNGPDPRATEPGGADPQAMTAPLARARAYRSPSRVGKRAAVAWLEPEAVKQLNLVAIQRDIHVQDILVEAVNDWFARHGLPRFDA